MRIPTPEEIKQIREFYRMSQKEAGKVVGRSAATWARWESGKSEMDPVWYQYFIESRQGSSTNQLRQRTHQP